ncbi:hypothetical protein ES703_100452 [subsurface metagenome]
MKIHKYTQEIRDIINEPRKQFHLIKNKKFWNQLCSSLDVIEDCDLAITAYIDGDFGTDHGEKYLKLYGILQALFLQQDAVANLCESLGLPNGLSSHPKLKDIRDIRNDSVGHPTKRGKFKSYHFIARTSIEKPGFTLVSDFENCETKSRDISVIDLIKDQRKYLTGILKNVINILRTEEKEHKEKFKMEKLEAIFPKTLSYYFQKIFENIGKTECAQLGLMDVKLINGVMEKLKEALQNRGIEIDTYDSFKYLYEELEYPIMELKLYFESIITKEEPRINEKAAYIFAYFIREQLFELKKIANEIDDEYSS